VLAHDGMGMNRRQLLKALLASGVVISGVGVGTFQFIEDGNKASLTVDSALRILDDFSDEYLVSIGEWNPSQIFTHCAQSVEFSISQFPEHKSEFFKGTVGHLAFLLFSSKGKMSHGLNEPIPGAPILTRNEDPIIALNRLKKSLIDFDKYQGDLAPHFAYGELTKDEYEKAHMMHLYNHLLEIRN
jgi:hypothetical protein